MNEFHLKKKFDACFVDYLTDVDFCILDTKNKGWSTQNLMNVFFSHQLVCFYLLDSNFIYFSKLHPDQLNRHWRKTFFCISMYDHLIVKRFQMLFFFSHFMNFRLSDIVYLFLKMLLATYLNKQILKFKLIRNESVDNSFIQLCFDRQLHKAQNEMFVKISKKNWISFIEHVVVVVTGFYSIR